MIGRVSNYKAEYSGELDSQEINMLRDDGYVKQPANYFYAEWVPSKVISGEYGVRKPQINEAVQVKHSITKEFNEPTQFISAIYPNGNIELKSLSEVGVYKQFTPDEYRLVQLVISRPIRKVDYDILPEKRRAEEFGFYHEIRAIIDDPQDMMLVNHSQNVLVNSCLTDMSIVMDCAKLDKFGGSRFFIEKDITQKYPLLKGVSHPEKERLLMREPFYGIALTYRVLLFDILENYMGSYNLVGQYMPSNFSELISELEIDEIKSVRVEKIDFFMKNIEGRRWRKGGY